MAKATNLQILTATKDGYNANVKELVDEALENNDLSVLSNIQIEDTLNVFVNLYNKYAKQVAFDPLSGWSHELVSMFMRDSAEMGEYTELVYLNNDPSEGFSNYKFQGNLTSEIFGDYRPEMYSDTIRIQKQVIWASSINADQLKRAMLNKYGIYDTVIGLILDSLEKKANIYLYNFVKAMLSTIEKSYVLKDVTVSGESNAKFNTEVLLTLGKKLGIPSTIYNDRGIISYVRKAAMVLTPNASANFDINVLAWAFNQRYADLNNTYRRVQDADVETYTLIDTQIVDNKEVVTTETVNLTGTVGYIFDEDKIRMEMPVKDTLTSPLDPIKRQINYFHHLWLKAGLNKGLVGIRLTTVVEKPTITLKGSKVTIKSNVLNAQDIYYTTDGSTPTSSSTKYTGEITLAGTETAIKAIAVSTEASKNSDVASLTLPEVESESEGD